MVGDTNELCNDVRRNLDLDKHGNNVEPDVEMLKVSLGEEDLMEVIEVCYANHQNNMDCR